MKTLRKPWNGWNAVERAPSSTSRLAFLRRTLDRKNPISGSRVLDTGPRGGAWKWEGSRYEPEGRGRKSDGWRRMLFFECVS